jgi:hypothetical protein
LLWGEDRFSVPGCQFSVCLLTTDDRRLAFLWEVIVEVIELELKYCERCGGLWLRAVGAPEIYCNTCLEAMEGPRAARRSKRRVRIPANSRLELVHLEGTQGCMEGGNA